jgi:REP element-mobilizing transposase RayT
MKFDPDIHHRRSIRLRDYDYSREGTYFVTVCVLGRECLLGAVEGGEMVPNAAGWVVQTTWNELPKRFPNIELDEFVVMPNHLHGIIVIEGARGAMDLGAMEQGAMNCAPTPPPDVAPVGARFIAPAFPRIGNHRLTLGEIIRTLKAVSTRMIRRDLMAEFGWQRNYHERIVRNEKDLAAIRTYIRANPCRWEEDAENPANSR